jgi:RNA polymerase sigma-70 factor (ECF subfamily)
VSQVRGLVEVSEVMRGDSREVSDFELLGMSRSSDEAFAVFYRRYERLIAGWLMRQTGQPEVVADLTAEVFAAAYIAAPRFREGPEPAGAWLLGIARNKLLRSLRRDRIEMSARRRLAVERVQVSDESLAAIEELRGCGALELLAGLPPGQREAVRARVIEQVDYHELALSAAISPELARKRVSRGLAALRKRMEQEGTER